MSNLNALKVVDLKNLCKERNLPVSGTKAELIARLNGEPKPVKTTPKSKVKPVPLEKPVVKIIERTPIVIKRNIHGNFEHVDSHLVFNASKKVIGVQSEVGTVKPLSAQDLENVYRYHFELDSSINIQDQNTDASLDDEEAKEARVNELIDSTFNDCLN